MSEEQSRTINPLTLFYCYVDQDEELCLALEKHLQVLQRQGMISSWHHRKMLAGAETRRTREEQLAAAQLILLFVSPDFLASDAAREEMQQALLRQEAGHAHVMALLLQPTFWEHTPIAQLQVLPRSGKPVTMWSNRDQAWVSIVKEIYTVVAQQQGMGARSPQLPLLSPFPFVFLSYARKEIDHAERLQDALMVQGIIASFDHQRGSSQEERLREVICNAEAVILVATPSTRSSSSVRAELQIAEMYSRPIYVLWLSGNQPHEAIPAVYHHVPRFDARKQYEQGLAKLLQTFGRQTMTSLPRSLLPEAAISPAITPRNPYKGLRAFRQEDAADFFGRDRLIDELVHKIEQMLCLPSSDEAVPRLLTVVGASGSGKSSVVMAGLLPKLRQGILEGSQHWIYLDPMVPGQHPLEALALTLASLFRTRNLSSIQQDLEDEETRGLHLLLTTYVQQSITKVVLLIDQLEELFTQTTIEEERQLFLDLLLTAVTEPDGPLVVITTLRADFSDRPLQYPAWGHLIETQHVTTYPLSLQEMRAVIEQPARSPRVQLTFEEDLVGDMLFEVQGQVGALPLLQFTLDQLFQRRVGQKLTRRAYQEIEGVQGALAHHAEATFHALPTPAHQKLARALFLRLIHPGTGTQDATKCRIPRSDLTVTDVQKTELLAKVTDHFIQARLLTTNTVLVPTTDTVQESTTAETSREVATVEISHEALISKWKRLAEWLAEGRNDMLQQQAIGAAAAEWLRHEESTDRLYRGSQLKEALVWRQANLPNLDEDRFLQASQQYEQKLRQRTLRRTLLIVFGGATGMVTVGWLVNVLRPTPSPPLGLPYTYKGHTGVIHSIAWSPDGKRIASGSDDKTVQVWDASSSIALCTYKGHTSAVGSVAWDPAGLRIASGSLDGVHIWDAKSGTLLLTYKGHTVVSSIAWEPSGKRIASASHDWTVQIWDTSNGTPLLTYKGYTGPVLSVAWSPDGKRIAAGDTRTIQVWDARRSGAPLFTYKGRTDTVRSVAWSPDGKRIASASDDKTVHVWDASDGTPLAICNGHSDSVLSVTWSPDSQLIASASSDDTVHIWNASLGTPLFIYKEHASAVSSVAWDPTGLRIASAGYDRTVRVWDASRRNIALFIYQKHTDKINSIAWSPDGQNIASASADHTVQVWEVSRGALIDSRRVAGTRVAMSIAWSPDGKSIVMAIEDTTAGNSGASSEETSPIYKGRSVVWSPDGKRIAVASSNHTAEVWDASNSTTLVICKGHTNTVESVAWSPDGTRIVSASQDSTVRIWDASLGTALSTYKGHTGIVASVAWSPDGKYIVSGSWDKTVRVWDANSGTLLLIYKGHADPVESVAWEPTGPHIASGSRDGTVQVWDAKRGTLLLTYNGHTAGVKSAKWSPDGQRIASAGYDSTVHIWDATA